MYFFWCLFPSCTFWILCSLLFLFKFCQVSLLVKKIAEIETRMAEKSSWEQANIGQKLDLVWRNRKKISQIIKDYLHLPFLLLIILWAKVLVYLVWDKRRHIANGGGTEGISCPSVNVFGKCGAISPFLVDLHANHTFPPLKRNPSVELPRRLNSKLLRLSK